MGISPEKIRILREKSGAGMVDCGQALTESGSDIEQAVAILRKKGMAKAATRSDRESSEGLIKVAVSADNHAGYMVELNSETDFVARNQQFKDFADKLFNLIKDKKPVSLEVLFGLPMADGTVKENLDNLSGVIGEKLAIKRFDILTSRGTVAGYSHMGGRIGVLVALSEPDKKELAYEIAMQVAAGSPRYIEPKDVPGEELEKERAIYREQLKSAGKPENIIAKIIDGKLNKYLEEVCLVKQEYIKDEEKKVSDVLGGVSVERFVRYSL